MRYSFNINKCWKPDLICHAEICVLGVLKSEVDFSLLREKLQFSEVSIKPSRPSKGAMLFAITSISPMA